MEESNSVMMIHIDDVLDNYRDEQRSGSEFGKMSLEEYIRYVGTYMKVYSDGE